jgi:hypothetical protein
MFHSRQQPEVGWNFIAFIPFKVSAPPAVLATQQLLVSNPQKCYICFENAAAG